MSLNQIRPLYLHPHHESGHRRAGKARGQIGKRTCRAGPRVGYGSDNLRHHLKFNPTHAECGQLLNSKVLPNLQRSFAYQFEERLAKRYTPAEQAIAEQILDELANCAQVDPGRRKESRTDRSDQIVLTRPDQLESFA